MSFTVIFSNRADRDLRKLDKAQARAVMAWIKKNLVDCSDPRRTGHALKGEFGEYWRYRVGDYRIVARIVDDALVLEVVEVGHRKNIYNSSPK